MRTGSGQADESGEAKSRRRTWRRLAKVASIMATVEDSEDEAEVEALATGAAVVVEIVAAVEVIAVAETSNQASRMASLPGLDVKAGTRENACDQVQAGGTNGKELLDCTIV